MWMSCAPGCPHELLDRNALAARGTRYLPPGSTHRAPCCSTRRAVPGLADALPPTSPCMSKRRAAAGFCRTARWWRHPRAACVRRSCCWRPMALRSSWVCLAVPGGGDVSAGHLWLAHCTAHARAAQRLGAPEGWGVTPASAVTGATLRYTDDHRILVRQGLNTRRISASAPRCVSGCGASTLPCLRRVFRSWPMWRWSILGRLHRHHPQWRAALGRLAPQVHGVPGAMGRGGEVHCAGALAADLALGQDHPLLAHALALGGPTRMPPEPFMGLGCGLILRGRSGWGGRRFEVLAAGACGISAGSMKWWGVSGRG